MASAPPSPTPEGKILATGLYRWTVATGLLAVVGFLTTGLAQPLAYGSVVLAGCLIVRGRDLGFVSRIPSWLSVVFLLLGIRHLRVGIPGIVVLSGFACGVMAMQWLQMDTLGKVRRGLLLSAMIVLAVAAMSVNFIFPLVLFPYVFFLMGTLSGLSRCEQGACRCRDPRFGHCQGFGFHLNPSLLGSYSLGGALFLVFWAGFFYLLPRPDVLGIAAGASKQRLMGFSDTLRLGEIGVLQDNPLVVMRVRTEMGSRVSPLALQQLRGTYLRGCSFVSYKKGSWGRGEWRKWPINLRQKGGVLTLREEGEGDPRPLWDFEILLEAVDPPILFVPDQTVSLRSTLPFVLGEPDGTLSFFFRRSGIEVYHAQVRLGTPPASTASEPAEIAIPGSLQKYLEVGDSSLSISDIAMEAASGSTTIPGKVEAVQRHLQKNCVYSLTESNAGVRDPVSHFLFNTQAGSCEHFASAMVLLLRYLGIPARPVSGYMMGEWNEFGSFFTVRQRDAHTWVEAHLPGRGWVSYDPTPMAPAAAAGYLEKWESVMALWNRVEGVWFNYVYRFDRNLQARGFQRMVDALNALPQSFLKHLAQPGWNFALGLGLGLVALVAVGVWNSGRSSVMTSERQGWLPPWYRAWGESWPLPRQAWETPREFHRRLVLEGRLCPPVIPLLQRLEERLGEAAFGKQGAPAALEGKELLARIQEELQQRKTGPSGNDPT